MNKKIRIILDIAIFISVIQGWWIPALALSAFGSWYFPYYFEIILAGIGFDALFGMVNTMGIQGYFGSIISISIFLIMYFLKKIMR